MRSGTGLGAAAAALLWLGTTLVVGAQGGPPGPPSNFAATVSGSLVTLSWNAPVTGGVPTSYTLDAGSAPGLSNVGTFPVGNVTGLSVNAPNGTYFVRVRATNAAGSSGASNEITIVVGTPIVPPGPPVNLQVAVTGTNVSLTWLPPASGGAPDSYVIDAGTAAGASNIGSIPMGLATSFSVNAPPGTYFARVRAVNAGGSSIASNEVTIIVGGAATPGAPQNLQFTVSGGNVTLMWGAPASGGPPSGYLIDAGTSAGASNIGSFPVPNQTSITVTAPQGTYYVRVRAQNAAGAGPASNEVVIIVGGTPTSIDGTWNGTTSQGQEFSFIVSNNRVTTTLVGGQFGSCTTTSQKSGLSHTVAPGSFSFSEGNSPGALGFSVNGTFASITSASGSASITATPIAGVGGCSGTINVTWTAANAGPGLPFKPGAPNSVTFGVLGAQVTINWTASIVGGAASSYSIEIGTASGASNAGTFSSTATTFATNLPPGAYFARVRAMNASGTSAPSAEIQFTIAEPPAAPTNLAAQVAGLTLTLTWSAPASGTVPTGYRVEIGTSPGASNTIDVSNATTQYSNSSLAAGTYYARVKATSAGSTGPASNEVTFTIVTGPGGNFNGTWNGETDQGIQFAFIVSNDVVTFVQGGGRQLSGGCSAETTRSNLSVPVINMSFSYLGSTPATGVGLQAVGTFASATSASGTLRTQTSNVGCPMTVTRNWTATNSGVGAPIVPPTPSGLFRDVNGGSVSFSWQAGTSTLGGPATSWDVEIGTSTGATDIGVFSSATTNYQKNDLAPGTYYARVRGRNASGTGKPTTEVSFTISAPPGAPGTVTFTPDTSSVQIFWSAPSTGGPVSSYDVEFGTTPGGIDAGVTNWSSAFPTNYSKFFSGPATQLTYYARVRARGAGGVGPASNEVVFALVPGSVSLDFPQINGSNVTLTWDAPFFGGPITEYRVEVGTSAGASNTGVFTTTNTQYEVMGLANGTYYARVVARNPYTSTTSNERSFTIP